MKKALSLLLLASIALMILVPVALATEGAATPAASGDVKQINYYGFAVLGAGLAIGLAGLGTGIGMGLGLRGATEGTARNPGVSGKIMTTLIIGLAMIESLAIYALVVVLIIFFVNPFKL